MENRWDKYNTLRSQMEMERQSFISHWMDCGNFIRPSRPRFVLTDNNRGERKNLKIIDATATLASRTLRSGMVSGMTSPARPWSRLTTPDPELAEFGPVKMWLHTVTQRMHWAFLRSNLYKCLPIVYGDMGDFGTAAIGIEEDFEKVMHFHAFPIGSYCLGTDDRGRVRVFLREFRMTVRQLVMKFGEKKQSGSVDWSNFSTHVKNQWAAGNYETWIDVCHLVQPNDEYDRVQLSSKFKKFRSVYFEKGTTGPRDTYYIEAHDKNKVLRDSGYDYFPILAPRWEVTGEDIYGTDCPGMTALGFIKAIQVMQKRKAEGVEKMVRPPMTGPSSLRNQKASILPGDITYVDSRDSQGGFRAAHETRISVTELREDIDDHRRVIQRAYFEDLFLMLAQSDRREITAEEIIERRGEKLLALGPVLEQTNEDLLDPLHDIAFLMLDRQGLIPPPPPELQGMELKTEYLSVMAQAQKLVGVEGIERFANFTGNIAKLTGDPKAIRKVNIDQMIDRYGDRLSIDPDIIRSDEEVAEMEQAEAKAAQAQAELQMIREGAGAARDLSAAKLEEDNALSRLLGSQSEAVA